MAPLVQPRQLGLWGLCSRRRRQPWRGGGQDDQAGREDQGQGPGGRGGLLHPSEAAAAAGGGPQAHRPRLTTVSLNGRATYSAHARVQAARPDTRSHAGPLSGCPGAGVASEPRGTVSRIVQGASATAWGPRRPGHVALSPCSWCPAPCPSPGQRPHSRPPAGTTGSAHPPGTRGLLPRSSRWPGRKEGRGAHPRCPQSGQRGHRHWPRCVARLCSQRGWGSGPGAALPQRTPTGPRKISKKINLRALRRSEGHEGLGCHVLARQGHPEARGPPPSLGHKLITVWHTEAGRQTPRLLQPHR